MTLLSDTFYLKRAGRYNNSLNSNDRLPIVYGDLTDGTGGIWSLPCIDTTAFVYCFAAHEVMSVVEGNSVSIYVNGDLENPANYTFDESNDYESEGAIATVTFTADQGNSIITARGKGKDASGTLIENIIDIVNDFLTVENDFTSAIYEASAKARASQIFTAQAYAAAGVIDQDRSIWEIIVEMMASFLGSAYLNGEGELVLEIDDGAISQYGQAGIIPKSDIKIIDARQRLENLINQCPSNYSYDYVTREFKSQTDETAHADTASQNIYGKREPNTPYQFYWCRDITTVQAVQDIIVGKFKNPVYEIEIEDVTLKRAHLDIGDVFIATLEDLYDTNENQLLNHYWRCTSVKPDYLRGSIRFRGLQTVYFLTYAYLADGTYDADGSIKAGGDRDTTIY